jgi:hypothetical protein
LSAARLRFFVPGVPVSFRGAYGASRRPSRAAIAYRQDVVACYRLAAAQDQRNIFSACAPHLGPVGLLLEVAGSRADWDNVGKEISDALAGWAYGDDSQVVNAKVKFCDRVLNQAGAVCRSKRGFPAGVHVTLVLWNIAQQDDETIKSG